MKAAVAAGLSLLVACSQSEAAWQIILPPGPAEEDHPVSTPADSPASQARRRPERPPEVTDSGCTVQVRRGDSLASLAKRHLGDPGRWTEIRSLNHIRNPDLIGQGWTLAVPCEGFIPETSPAPRRDPRDPPEPVPEETAEAAGSGEAEPAPQALAQQVIAELDATAAEVPGSEATGPGHSNAMDPAGRVQAAVTPPGGEPADRSTDPAEPAGAALADAKQDAEVEPASTGPADETVACSITVRTGDSLASLAERHLGEAARWIEIQGLNQIPDPDLIAAGQVLDLPCDPGAGLAPSGSQAPESVRSSPPGLPATGSAEGTGPWVAHSGELLDDVIARWAIEAGWTPIITERWHWVLDTDVALSGPFLEGVHELLSGFSVAGEAPGVGVYDNRHLILEYR